MQKLVIAVFVVLSLVLLEVTCQDAMLAPPNRPSEFKSPDQLRQYLKALNEYYAIVGRPRFGRSAHRRSINDNIFGSLDKNE
ncbi:pro-neuropeptide Y-like [Gigantopelta aegis]|uniref:pro-neuropeptide Y-like n=1 Tax=Gigantopelta aegis TaxID=1735272 RepID=UPI001B88B5B1|nr:pro-neuropeptide Y-like [Gigantopelta aegis]XP_041372366.1 pro-neuropeptide Y-like [Gigantopelta aegis]